MENACFTKEELLTLMGEVGGKILFDEQIAHQKTTICPYCGGNHFQYIGLKHFSTANTFRCHLCSFEATME